MNPVTGSDAVAVHHSSEGVFFRPEETPFSARLERRPAKVMNHPLCNGEGLRGKPLAPRCAKPTSYNRQASRHSRRAFASSRIPP
jgi:hypothetical protein